MGLKVNSSEGSRVSKLYSGIENFKILVFSPTTSQAKEVLGIEKKEEPKYITDKDGNTQVRIEVWFDNGDTENPCRFPHSFFLINKEVFSKDGTKREVINSMGVSTWLPVDGEVPETMTWFDTNGIRTCVDGESEFTAFIKNYINHNSKNKEECQLDVQSYFKGNFSQLNSILSNNKVKCACGVKQSTDNEGKVRYQQVIYSRVTERPYGDGEKIKTAINEAKSQSYLSNVYFGEPDYTFVEVKDASKLAFFQADDPSNLATNGGGTTNAF